MRGGWKARHSLGVNCLTWQVKDAMRWKTEAICIHSAPADDARRSSPVFTFPTSRSSSASSSPSYLPLPLTCQHATSRGSAPHALSNSLLAALQLCTSASNKASDCSTTALPGWQSRAASSRERASE